MAGFDNDTVYADNADFTTAGAGGGSSTNGLQTNGQMWIGTTAVNAGGTHINVGALTSPNNTITIGYSSPNITLDLTGGGVGIDSIAVQTGTSPVVPTAAGLITYNGAVVAAGTNPVRTNGTAVNTMALEVQISQALAAADATKIGLANFDSASFAVDANGFVTASGTGLAKTITGDSGGALAPTAGNWNILGGPGITTSGSGSTLTIQSVVFSNRAVNASLSSDTGSFVTAAAVTLTLPAGPGQGDEIIVVATTADTFIVDAPGTQLIRIGNAISSAGGIATSSGSAGDVLVLRYYASSTTWIATSVIGVWITA